jgi:hypothetical protein
MIWQERIFSKDECNKIIEYSNLYPIIEDKFNRDGKFIKNGDITIDGNRLTHRTSFSYNFYSIPNNDDTEWMFDKLINWFESKSGVQINTDVKMIDTGLHHYIKGDKFNKHTYSSKRDVINNYDWSNYGLVLLKSKHHIY